jgi:hypothetical protein
MSSIDLTVTSGIAHLRRRAETCRTVQLGDRPKLIAAAIGTAEMLGSEPSLSTIDDNAHAREDPHKA